MQIPPWSPAQTMDHVVNIGIPEARVDDSLSIGDIIAILVREEEKLGGATDIGPALNGYDGVGNG